MGYANRMKSGQATCSEKDHSPNRKRIVKITIGVALLAVACWAHYYIKELQSRQYAAEDAELIEHKSKVERIHISGSVRRFLISLKAYYEYDEVDAESDFNAMFCMLKLELNENGHIDDAIDKFVKKVIANLEHDKYDIIKDRRAANNDVRKYGCDSKMTAASRDYMRERFKLYVQLLNMMYFECFDEPDHFKVE